MPIKNHTHTHLNCDKCSVKAVKLYPPSVSKDYGSLLSLQEMLCNIFVLTTNLLLLDWDMIHSS